MEQIKSSEQQFMATQKMTSNLTSSLDHTSRLHVELSSLSGISVATAVPGTSMAANLATNLAAPLRGGAPPPRTPSCHSAFGLSGSPVTIIKNQTKRTWRALCAAGMSIFCPFLRLLQGSK